MEKLGHVKVNVTGPTRSGAFETIARVTLRRAAELWELGMISNAQIEDCARQAALWVASEIN